ncbi:MAG: hypothetical protein JJU13_04560 [Balneolaceae bacterium]|jgi:hypothetical protein|nr:hypothetical protein [Balneolaceae bacterium]
MKTFFYFFAIILISVLIISVLPELLSAQPAPPPLPDKPAQTPIDGGLGLLAAAGGAYAIKKIKDRKNNSSFF